MALYPVLKLPIQNASQEGQANRLNNELGYGVAECQAGESKNQKLTTDLR